MRDPYRVEVASVVTDANSPGLLFVESTADDSNLDEPTGVDPMAVRSIGRRLEIENVGDTALDGLEVVFNGREVSSVEGILDVSGAGAANAADPIALFRGWTELRATGPASTTRGVSPIHVASFLALTSSVTDAGSLARLFSAAGIPARVMELPGNRAVEASLAGGWALFDGARETFFPGLDGRPASFQAVAADPFLAIRVPTRGRGGRSDPKRSWAASAAFDDRRAVIGTSYQPQALPKLPEVLALFPGERLTYSLDHAPRANAGLRSLPASTRDAVFRSVTLDVDVSQRAKGHPRALLTVPLPVVGVAVDGAPAMKFDKRELARVVALESGPEGSVARVEMQASRVAMPRVRAGSNFVLVRSKSAGRIRARLEYRPIDRVPPVAGLAVDFARGVALVPSASASARPTRVHWQIDEDDRFHHLAPSLDVVQPYVSRIELTPIERTHLLPGKRYRVRARVEVKGLWSPFSDPISLVDDKPASPTNVRVKISGDEVVLEFDAPAGARVLVFGSDRRDFVPDVYLPYEVDEVNGNVVSTSSVSNQLLSVDERSVRAPLFRFYRLIAERRGVHSLPSELVDSGVGIARALRFDASEPGRARVVDLVEAPEP
ncbi:MAG: hypothetical protein HYV07_11425 [Deltaproteobacteria bacterium]|nr:hypothetical protein [Deltaproteobacteria bacterium]